MNGEQVALLYEIKEVKASIVRHERLLIDNPSPSVEASMRSLKKRLRKFEAEYGSTIEHADQMPVDQERTDQRQRQPGRREGVWARTGTGRELGASGPTLKPRSKRWTVN